MTSSAERAASVASDQTAGETPSQSMVERVARAIEPTAFKTAMQWFDTAEFPRFRDAEDEYERWEWARQSAYRKARAAIEAMREPTEAQPTRCGAG